MIAPERPPFTFLEFLFGSTWRILLQIKPISSSWSQLCSPQSQWVHFSKLLSFPLQETWSSQIGPLPTKETTCGYFASISIWGALFPKKPFFFMVAEPAKPNWLHAILAASSLKSSSHIEPHIPRCLTSSLPSLNVVPLTSRNAVGDYWQKFIRNFKNR